MRTIVKRNGTIIDSVEKTPAEIVKNIFVDSLKANFEKVMQDSDIFNPSSWTAIDEDTGSEWELIIQER